MKCYELKEQYIELQNTTIKIDKELTETKKKLHDAEMAKDDAEAANTEYRLEIEKLKESQRWRNVSEEFPTADDGYILALYEDGVPDIGYIGAEEDVIETVRDRGEGHSIEWWMPLPKKPEEADK